MANRLHIRVLFFARAQELAGRSRDSIEVPEPATAGDVENALKERYPWLGRELATYRIALDQEFVSRDAPVEDGAELAIIPPVSGG